MRRSLALSTIWAVLLLSCSIPLGPTARTTLTLTLDSGRAVAEGFAYWTIEGLSAKGTNVPLTTFDTTQGTLKGITADTWTFDVKVYDESDALVQVASATTTIVAGQANTVAFQLDPVITIGIGIDSSEPSWVVVPEGDFTALPFLDYPYHLKLTAPVGFDSYTWIVNGVSQPETGTVWETGPMNVQEDRLDVWSSSILLIVTLDGQSYSVEIPVEKVAS